MSKSQEIELAREARAENREAERRLEQQRLQTVYAHFTLREWQIITASVREAGLKCILGIKHPYPDEIDSLLGKCPSASL